MPFSTVEAIRRIPFSNPPASSTVGLSPAERVPGTAFHLSARETPKHILSFSWAGVSFITSSSEQEAHTARLTHAATSMPALHVDFNRVVISFIFICSSRRLSARLSRATCDRKGNIQPRPACDCAVTCFALGQVTAISFPGCRSVAESVDRVSTGCLYR